MAVIFDCVRDRRVHEIVLLLLGRHHYQLAVALTRKLAAVGGDPLTRLNLETLNIRHTIPPLSPFHGTSAPDAHTLYAHPKNSIPDAISPAAAAIVGKEFFIPKGFALGIPQTRPWSRGLSPRDPKGTAEAASVARRYLTRGVPVSGVWGGTPKKNPQGTVCPWSAEVSERPKCPEREILFRRLLHLTLRQGVACRWRFFEVESQRWRVGELARATGLTVRALHHYEAVGLLPPAARTEAGHRVYGPKDVSHLYRVMALRSLGLGLNAIRDCLARDDGALVHIVRRHLAEVDWSIDEQTRLRSRLQFILGALERDEEPSADRFLEALEAMTMFERYFSQEQLAELQERHRSLGDDAVKGAQEEWSVLLAQADTARKAGVDPGSPELNELWRRMQELIEQFTGGNPAIRQSLQKMYETEDITQASRGAVSPELWDYMRRGQMASN